MTEPHYARPVRCDGWTPARRARFLAALGEGANISLAVRACGMSRQSAYVLRRRNVDFARDWDLALAGFAQRQYRESLAILADLQARALRKAAYPDMAPRHRQRINLVSTSRGHVTLAVHERVR